MIFDSIPELYKHMQKIHPDSLVVLTNGCFDVLHVGHTRLLKFCKSEASSLSGLYARPVMVVVAVDSDQSVMEAKGPSRPHNTFSDRAEVIDALSSTNIVIKMSTASLPYLITALRPAIYVKGSDYHDRVPSSDIASLIRANSEIKFFDIVRGVSSSRTISKITSE